MSKLINGSYNFNYASIIGGTGITSDMVMDIGTTNTIEQTITTLESNMGTPLTGNITIGTTNANTLIINSGSTTYNNNEIITLNDNSTSSYILGSAGNTNMMVFDTSDATSNVNLSSATNLIINNTNDPASSTDITSALVVSGGITCAKKLYVGGILTNTNVTDSTSSTGAIFTSGGICSTKKLYVGGNINGAANITVTGNMYGTSFNCSSLVSSGAISGTTFTGTGAITVGANSVTCGACYAVNVVCSGAASVVGLTSTGAITIGTNSITCGLLTSSSAIVLPTSGGTASNLNYYEEATISIAIAPSGGGAYIYNGSAYVVRIGKKVTLRIPAFTGDTLGGYMNAAAASGIPSRFRPPANTSFPIPIQGSNGSVGVIQIYMGELRLLTTGVIQIYMIFGAGGTFTSGPGSGLVNDVNVSWSVL